MRQSATSRPRLFVAVASALGLAAGPVFAQGLQDIVAQDTGWGSRELRSRGYTLISSHWQDGENIEYWWQGSSNTCIQARSADGRYGSLRTTGSTDCNQYHESATKNDNAAAIAIGAAALIGVAVLAHKSHERNEKHGQDSKSVAEFDRGYRDGLHHERYHNYDNTSAYSDGYSAGQQERDQQTDYRSGQGRHSGSHPYVSLTDLVGARASGADSELRARGFATTGGYQDGNKSVATWYNRRTRQCVNAITKDGRIKRFEDIDEGNCR